ncbi:MAG TPA: hypothetical protein VE959_31815 [Bryobacteraceae bacterium]|nr:hypothetical protein SBA4_1010025 [Candidatus Sulfopaludibacter sp. SbA4]HYW47499.1 hypothetical protein [Bryobacteraceae bacterium]
MGNKPSRSKIAEAAIDEILRAIREEYAGELEAMRAAYVADYAPATDMERVVLDLLASWDWQQRCLDRVEARIWTEEIEKAEGSPYPLGEAWCKRSDDFMRIQRRMDMAQRSYYKTLETWERLRKARKAARRPAKPAFNLADLPNASRWRM